MTFAHPWVLSLLCIPIFICMWEMTRSGHQVALPFDHVEPKHKSWLNRTILTFNLLPALLLAVIICLLAGPLVAGKPQQQRMMTNIEICLDVSGSMTAGFGSGTSGNGGRRADAAMYAVQQFTQARKGDAFGLTIFGTEYMKFVPLTKDLKVIETVTPFADPGKLPYHFGGTSIGKALKYCHSKVSKEEEGDRMVILISDGQSGDIRGEQGENIARMYAAENIILYAIHIGNGAPPSDLFVLCEPTGGEVFGVDDPQGLERVFQRIDQMQPAKLKPSAVQKVDSYYWFAIIGLACSGLYLFSLLGWRYTPW